MSIKAGDVVYRVYRGFGGYEIQSATVNRVTDKYVFLANAGLAFRCSSSLHKGHVYLASLTPHDAVRTFVEREREAYNHALMTWESSEKWAKSQLADVLPKESVK